jgi:hypothetical protein
MKHSDIKNTARVSRIRSRGRKQFETAGKELEGYPQYPPEEDIYAKFREEPEINPEDPSNIKTFDTQDETGDAVTQENSGKNLDIPGAELDDEQEIIGSEDEENNHYSIGGDNHEDLEENREQV